MPLSHRYSVYIIVLYMISIPFPSTNKLCILLSVFSSWNSGLHEPCTSMSNGLWELAHKQTYSCIDVYGDAVRWTSAVGAVNRACECNIELFPLCLTDTQTDSICLKVRVPSISGTRCFYLSVLRRTQPAHIRLPCLNMGLPKCCLQHFVVTSGGLLLSLKTSRTTKYSSQYFLRQIESVLSYHPNKAWGNQTIDL